MAVYNRSLGVSSLIPIIEAAYHYLALLTTSALFDIFLLPGANNPFYGVNCHNWVIHNRFILWI